jgi:hypothetical protein
VISDLRLENTTTRVRLLSHRNTSQDFLPNFSGSRVGMIVAESDALDLKIGKKVLQKP